MERSTRAAPAGRGEERPAGAWRPRSGGPDAERDRDGLRLAVAAERERDLVAGSAGRDGRRQVVGARHGLAVDGRDHVAGLQAGLVGGRAGDDRPDAGAGAGRNVADLDAEVGVLDLAARDDGGGDALDGVDGDREPDAVVAARVALDLGVDADHVAARVEQRAAGVAVVDRRIGLDRAGDRVVVRRLDGAVDGADDAGGHGAGEAEGAADGDDLLARLHRGRGAQGERMEQARVGVDPDHGDVGPGIGADQRRLGGLAALEADGDRLGAVDDVRVRQDVTLRVVDDPGALGLRLLLTAEAEAVRRARGDRDVDDARRDVLVEL